MSGLWADQAPGVDGRLYGEDETMYEVEIPVEVFATVNVRLLSSSRDEAERRAREAFPRLRFVSASLSKSDIPSNIDAANTEMVVSSVRMTEFQDFGVFPKRSRRDSIRPDLDTR